MGILARLLGRGRPGASAPVPQRRSWLGAAPSRLLADLPGGAATAPNRDIRQDLRTLRNRARWLAQNDGFSRGFLLLLRRNVVGAAGFVLKMAVPADKGAGLDTDANARLESAWREWAQVGACDVTGRLSWPDVLRLAIVGVARDGEALVRLCYGPFNRAGMALQLLDPGLLDVDLNVPAGGTFAGYRLAAGVEIRCAVERDGFGRPLGYWLRTALEGDDCVRYAGRLYVRVPAEELLHLFQTDWPGAQVRGVPWLANAIRSLAMLDGYSEAELTAARVAAAKMGFYEVSDAEDVDGELAGDGSLVQQAEAGSFELLPKGVKLNTFDPQHPNAGFAAFCAAILRQAAAGVGTSYSAFANDAAGLNYSALRATHLEDRDEYRVLQDWLVGAMAVPIFSAWLRAVLLSGITGLPPGKAWKFNAPRFTARGWDWVDPLKEVAAAERAVALRIKSRTQIVAAQGGDFAQTVADLEAEEVAMANLPKPIVPGAAAAPVSNQED